MKIEAMLTSESDEWGTPRPLFDSINRALGLTLDVAARSDQTMTARFYSKRDGSLARSWAGERFWMNPPYSKIGTFTRTARRWATMPRTLGAWLIPVRTDTEWWRNSVLQLDQGVGALLRSVWVQETQTLWLRHALLVTGVRYLKGRQTFRLPPGSKSAKGPAPFASAVVIQATPEVRPLVEGTEWTKGWPS